MNNPEKKWYNFSFNLKAKEALLFYGLITPFIIMLFFMKLYPIGQGIWLSFTNFTGFNYGSESFIGVSNYQRIFSDVNVLYSFERTLLIGLISVPLSMSIGLALALLLAKPRKGIGIFRVIFYIPALIPVIVSGMMWKGIFQRNNGLLNILFTQMGLKPLDWLGYDLVTASLIIMMLWTSGSSLLINIAALRSVPQELYEAADLDGATKIQRFFRVTFPMITPSFFFNLLMGIISTLQLFTQPVLLTEGDNWSLAILNVPLKPNYTYLVHVYQQILVSGRYGYGLALIWVIFAVIMALTLIVYGTSKFWVHYESD